jgi:CHAT domain-containing protein
MIINHKPFKRLKGMRGKGQSKITSFKSREEYKKEIKELESTRYNYYYEYVKELQLLSIEFKKTITYETNKQYVDTSEQYKKAKTEYEKKKLHATNSYNELVKPIDKKLKELRLEIIKNFPISYKKIDERLK